MRGNGVATPAGVPATSTCSSRKAPPPHRPAAGWAVAYASGTFVNHCSSQPCEVANTWSRTLVRLVGSSSVAAAWSDAELRMNHPGALVEADTGTTWLGAAAAGCRRAGPLKRLGHRVRE